MNHLLAVFALAASVAVIVATLIAGRIGRSGFPLPAEDRRIGCVDGLRGYLALSVLLHHAYIWLQATRLGGSWTAPSINVLNQLGAGAVGLFFITTGFVFYPRVLTGLRKTSWPGVYLSRLFRIVPLVVVSVCIVTAIIVARGGARPTSDDLGSAGLWIVGWEEAPLLGHADSGRINSYVLWSLWYEWLFYVFVLPVSAGAMDLIRLWRLPSWTVPAILLGVGVVARTAVDNPLASTSVLYFLPLFATGMLAFELRRVAAIRAALSTAPAALLGLAALLWAMIATPAPDGTSIPLFGLFFACVACGNSLFGLLRTRGALILGECSFGIYLLHGILLDVLLVDTGALDRWSTPQLLALIPVAAAAVAAIAPLTFLAVERPSIRKGKSLARSIAGAPVGATLPQA